MPRDETPRALDPLSSVLSTLQLRGDVYARTEAASPWAIAFPRGEARFHVIERGEVWGRVEGVQRPFRAGAGDLVVIPHGAPHTLGDRIDRPSTALVDLVKNRRGNRGFVFHVGRGRADTLLSCGRFHLDSAGREAFLAALPPLLLVAGQGGRPAEPLALALRLYMTEIYSDAPGAVIASARLVELILVHAIRAWLERQPPGAGGWLGAIRDRHVGAALAAMHAAPARSWTVPALASVAGLSRSPFASRFTGLVGEPPLRYLTRWRMHLANQLLRGGQSVHEVAEAIGYASEAAFSRTFKRHFGRAPVKVRGARRSPT
jgi:AraC-like DNA-binding protein